MIAKTKFEMRSAAQLPCSMAVIEEMKPCYSDKSAPQIQIPP